MKKIRNIYLMIIIGLLISGCGSARIEKPNQDKVQLNENAIKNIAELSTHKAYYHSVAQGKKLRKTGLGGIIQKERKFWIEFTGNVDIGIDMNLVSISIEDENIKIKIPKARVLTDVDIEQETFNQDSYVIEDDNLFKNNPITVEDQREAISKARKDIIEKASNDQSLLNRAQDRAKDLIKNYVNQIGDASGVNYNIIWEDVK